MSSSACAAADIDITTTIRVASVIPLVPAWRVDRTFDYSIPSKLDGDTEVGSLVRMPFGGRRVRGVIVGIGEGDERELEELSGIVVKPPVVPPPLDEIFDWIAMRYVAPRGRVYARAVPPRVRVQVERSPAPSGSIPPETLSQYERGNDLARSIESGGAKVWCLESLPGEDRARLIGELVSLVKTGSSIVAVPEVRYGSLVLEGLGNTFPRLARLDSSRSDGERSRSWLQMSLGNALGGGGRASVLAPASDLRLIVIDEEHHVTYKEDRSPRYDARQVAIERADKQDAVCVLISSAPSVETGAAAAQGRFGWVVPSREARRAARPVIELTEPDGDEAISRVLHRRMKDVIGNGGRVALLAPSRGYARAVWCAQCHRTLRCVRCEAGLSFDLGRSGNRLRCPRCTTVYPAPDVCPSCGAVEFRWLGAGTQRLAEQLAKTWPRSKVAHVDPEDIEAMARSAGNADIYVTTWIGTKAVLRPDVSLVGILDADALIRRPQFRGAEQAFQGLTEMAEWAGPASTGGRLLIQSREHNHYVLQGLVRGDYRFLLERELAQREELGYPPFSELIRVTASGAQAERTLELVSETARAAQARVLGPIGVRSHSGDAIQLLIKCSQALPVATELRRHAQSVPSGTRLTIDVDPR